MEWIKKNIAATIITLVFGAVLTLLGTLYAEQNKKIDSKADQQVLIQMIEKLEQIRVIKEQEQKEHREEQKELNQKHQQVIQDLTQQIWILNQRLKVEE